MKRESKQAMYALFLWQRQGKSMSPQSVKAKHLSEEQTDNDLLCLS
jgi:hypothetical protein